MINKAHELPVSRQVKLLKISRGTVYYLPKPVSTADVVLMRHIDKSYPEHPFMGARMLRDQLGLLGLHVGRRPVRTLMRRMDIEAMAPEPGTSQAPARLSPATRSNPTCSGTCPSSGLTGSGHWTRPTLPWPKASFTWPLWSMWLTARYLRTKLRLLWRRVMPRKRFRRRLPNSAHLKLSTPTKAVRPTELICQTIRFASVVTCSVPTCESGKVVQTTGTASLCCMRC